MEFRLFLGVPNYIAFNVFNLNEEIKSATITIMDRRGNIFYHVVAESINDRDKILNFKVDGFNQIGIFTLDLTFNFLDRDFVKQYIIQTFPSPVGIEHYYHNFEVHYENSVRTGLYNMSGLQPMSAAKELGNLRGYFNEAAELFGTDVELYLIEEFKYDAASDPIIKYHPPKLLKILFDDRPRIRTLESLGWYHHDSDIIPLLVHIPRVDMEGKDIRLKSWCYLKFQNMLHEVNETEFLLSRFRSSDIYPVFWVATIVPKSSVYSHHISIEGRNMLNRNKPLIEDRVGVTETIEVEYKPEDRPVDDTHTPGEPTFFKY